MILYKKNEISFQDTTNHTKIYLIYNQLTKIAPRLLLWGYFDEGLE